MGNKTHCEVCGPDLVDLPEYADPDEAIEKRLRVLAVAIRHRDGPVQPAGHVSRSFEDRDGGCVSNNKKREREREREEGQLVVCRAGGAQAPTRLILEFVRRVHVAV